VTRVFLSYAEDDGELALRLVSWFEELGVDLFWWQDPGQRGKRFVGEIEDGIGGADLFLVLMSPHYLSSPWCRQERDLAIACEANRTEQFVFVVKAVDTDYAESGFLRNYGWIDADDENFLDVLRAALPLNSTSVAVRVERRGPQPAFRNRQDELNAILNAVTTLGGRDLWLVISPPRLGKSWFLNRLQRELADRVGECLVRLVDLREHSAGLRGDPARLLGRLLDLDSALVGTGALSESTQLDIAAELSRRSAHQLYLLDSADLLDTGCASQLRVALGGIYQALKRTGTTTRFSLVVASRRNDDWKGIGPGGGTRFHPVSLTEFGVDVVHQALTELPRTFDADRRWEYAHRLHRLSEGLPALLIRGLEWAERTAFLRMHESDHQATFDSVAEPYIRDDLLSVESLFPHGGPELSQAKDLVERALRTLAVYRLFTLSHLRYHVDDDPSFREALTNACWTPDDLWRAVSRTALLKRPLDEPWQVLHPPVRRLLHRYYHRTDDARRIAHATARRFYTGWTNHNAGKEQGVVLLECLWHEAATMVTDDIPDLGSVLPAVAGALAGEFVKSSIYDPIEVSEFVEQRLREDEELQLLVQDVDGLFDSVVDSVVATISSGGA